MTEAKGNWIVEAMEPFEDVVNGVTIKVKKGERRIAAPNLLHEKKELAPPVKEHAYELKMEKKLRKAVKDEERKELEPSARHSSA